jgi:hypothetical protein
MNPVVVLEGRMFGFVDPVCQSFQARGPLLVEAIAEICRFRDRAAIGVGVVRVELPSEVLKTKEDCCRM